MHRDVPNVENLLDFTPRLWHSGANPKE